MSNYIFGPFSGCNPRFDPSHLKSEVLADAVDVDFSRGSLRPMRSDRLISASTGNTLHADDCCVKTYPNCVRIAAFDFDCEYTVASGVTGYDYPVIAKKSDFCAGNYCRLGWDCSFSAPTVSYGGAQQDEREAQPRSYLYTFVSALGHESPPSLPSPLTTLNWSVHAQISGFSIPDSTHCVQYINVYSLFAGMSSAVGASAHGDDEYIRVATIPISQLMFTHNPSVQPPQEALMTEDYVPVPSDATDFWSFSGSNLAFQSNGALRFTEPFNPSVAPLKYEYRPQEKLIRIAATPKFTYLITCGRPEVLSTQAACDESGQRDSSQAIDSFPLIGKESVCVFGDSVFFASVTGLIQMTGANAKVLTSDVFAQDDWDALQPHTMRCAYYNGYIYCSTDIKTFRLEVSGSGKSNAAERFSFLSFTATAFKMTADDRLLYADANGVWELGQGPGFKSYKATLKRIASPNKKISSVVRINMEGHNLSFSQKIISDCGKETTMSKSIVNSGVFRLGRRLGNSFSVTLGGTAEVSSIIFGDSIAGVTSK